jgi:hypothetical protein
MEDSKHPLEWFEARVGSFIIRAPYFKDEVDRGQPVTIKVSTKDHALKLYSLQRNDRPTYVDNKENLTLDNGTISKRTI